MVTATSLTLLLDASCDHPSMNRQCKTASSTHCYRQHDVCDEFNDCDNEKDEKDCGMIIIVAMLRSLFNSGPNKTRLLCSG